MLPKLKNWAGNFEYSTTNIAYPETVEQVQALVARTPKLKVLGTRHTFNAIADSTEQLVSLERLQRLITIDHDRRTVTISANVRYGDLCPIIHREVYALHNMASLPHVSVLGACITGTHGSGMSNQCLAAAVSALDLVVADGSLIHLSREQDGDLFNGAVVSLGALGVIVSLTLDLLPAFDMSQTVYLNLPLSTVESYFEAIMSSAYSVSLFTDWQHPHINQVWVKRRLDATTDSAPSDFFGAPAAYKPLHPIAALSSEPCTVQLGIPGAWHDRLPHFRIDATPSVGNELQAEYMVPRHHAPAALHAVSTLGSILAPELLISEIRCVAADHFWMSPYYQRDTVGIHFTWGQDWTRAAEVLPLIETQLAPFDPRPHWGKLFTIAPERVQGCYEKLPQFRQLLTQHDPDGKFRNAFLDAMLFSGA